MNEREKYTPENRDYGTKHDGELIFPDYIEETLRQYIHRRLEEFYSRKVAEQKIILPLSSEIRNEEDHWYEQARLIYTELLKQHSSSFSSGITSTGEDLNLKQTFNQLDSRMPKIQGPQTETPPKKQVGN
jgi:hypothetical protein